MKKVICEYPIERAGVILPLNAEILTAERVRSQICIYAIIDPTETAKKFHKIFILRTGETIDENQQEQMKNMTFLNAIIEPGEFFGPLVWHVWVEK